MFTALKKIFIFREEEREKEKKRNINVQERHQPVAPCMPPTRDLA